MTPERAGAIKSEAWPDKEKHGLHFIPAPFHFHVPLCVIPAKAGIQKSPRSGESFLQSFLSVFTFPWIPAFAGMTHSGCFCSFFIASGITRDPLLIAPPCCCATISPTIPLWAMRYGQSLYVLFFKICDNIMAVKG